jgi:hypothetical protein
MKASFYGKQKGVLDKPEFGGWFLGFDLGFVYLNWSF